MRIRQMPCGEELHTGEGAGGTLIRADVSACREELARQYGGQVQTIYLDPPFFTGKTFSLRQRVGEAGWKTGKPVLALPAYDDRWPDEATFLAQLRESIELAHTLLSEDGSLFLHIDSRMHARLRLLLDDVFGEANFVNEIIWAYQSGGRSLAHFSRKHDVILFYRKSPKAYFNIKAVGLPRAKRRNNHMRRSVDADGRPYQSIISQGKEYRYYDDEPVYPGDVWDDVSHMQQKDPQRTGYDNQKPMRLLERIILCSSRPGDLVCDLYAGSGTTMAAAAQLGRRFLGVDKANVALAVARKRLLGQQMRIQAATDVGAPRLQVCVEQGLGFYGIELKTFALEEGLCSLPLGDTDAVEQLSAGYLREGVFCAYSSAARTKLTPALPASLELPMLEGLPALLTVDILGRRLLHVLEVDADGQ